MTETLHAKPYHKLSRFIVSRWTFLGFGLLLGSLTILGIRFATYQMPNNHYHANFAVFLEGKRFEFKDPKYYESVAICSSGTGITIPQQRAHMHDNINSVVHVHDSATTWGQFFENLGWFIGPDFIQTDDGTLYRNNGQQKLHILIDGQDYTDLGAITNRVIGDKSQLLISFGDLRDEVLQQENKSIPQTAHKFDETKDSGSCSGHETTVSDRFRHMF